MKRIGKKQVALLAAVALTSTSGAAVIGAGVGILDAEGANNTVDTSSDGTSDQSRVNIDITFTSTLGPGIYEATSWTFQSGQTGSVIPYIAVRTSENPRAYDIIGVGAQVDVAAVTGSPVTVPFGGSSFELTEETEIFAGINNPPVAGSQNPISTNLAFSGVVDHNNNSQGEIHLPVVGESVDGFGHANLSRSYAFSINVEPVPEPSSMLLLLASVGGFLSIRRRK